MKLNITKCSACGKDHEAEVTTSPYDAEVSVYVCAGVPVFVIRENETIREARAGGFRFGR